MPRAVVRRQPARTAKTWTRRLVVAFVATGVAIVPWQPAQALRTRTPRLRCNLRRALLLYCLTLPFALLPVFGYGTVLGTAAIAYTLFGIEEIGVEIEDPFGTDDNDLPLDDICRNIDRNLRALLPATHTQQD